MWHQSRDLCMGEKAVVLEESQISAAGLKRRKKKTQFIRSVILKNYLNELAGHWDINRMHRITGHIYLKNKVLSLTLVQNNAAVDLNLVSFECSFCFLSWPVSSLKMSALLIVCFFCFVLTADSVCRCDEDEVCIGTLCSSQTFVVE